LVAVTGTAISLVTIPTASTSTPSASPTFTTAIFELHVVSIRRRWLYALGEGAREGWRRNMQAQSRCGNIALLVARRLQPGRLLDAVL
jgi:hypothetical protein